MIEKEVRCCCFFYANEFEIANFHDQSAANLSRKAESEKRSINGFVKRAQDRKTNEVKIAESEILKVTLL